MNARLRAAKPRQPPKFEPVMPASQTSVLTPVAYVLGHYPRMAQTFIHQEIRSLEDHGQPVVPISVNVPPVSDRDTDELREEHARTFYVKSMGTTQVARVLVRALRTSPGGLVATLVLAVRSAGFDLRSVVFHMLYLVEGLAVWDHCRSRGVRHLHTHFVVPTSNVAWFASVFGCQVDGPASWTWSLTVHGPHDFFDEPRMLLPQKVASLGAIVCITDFARSQVIRQLEPADWYKVHVVRCGIDLRKFARRCEAPAGDPPIVLVVGRLAPEKGHRVLIEAARLLHGRGLAIGLEFVGAGPDAEALANEAKANGLLDDVNFAGPMPSDMVARRLHAADVFCLPSFAEGLPIAIMEAMAVGVPVVSTSVGGITELVITGKTGSTVPPGRADLLADALEFALQHDLPQQAMIDSARVMVEQEHDLTAQASKLVAVFASVQARRRASS